VSRESWEISEQFFLEEMFGKGPGDPDRVGHYPGEPVAADRKRTTRKTLDTNKQKVSRLEKGI
jgi:hypothetical protein